MFPAYIFIFSLLLTLLAAVLVTSSYGWVSRQIAKAAMYIWVKLAGYRKEDYPVVFRGNTKHESGPGNTWNPLPRCCHETNPQCWNNNCWPNPTGFPSRLWSYLPTDRLHILAWLPETEHDGVFSAFFPDLYTAQDVFDLACVMRWQFLQPKQEDTSSETTYPIEAAVDPAKDNEIIPPITVIPFDYITVDTATAPTTQAPSPNKLVLPVTDEPIRTTPMTTITQIPAPTKQASVETDETPGMRRTQRMKRRPGKGKENTKKTEKIQEVKVKPRRVEKEVKQNAVQECIPKNLMPAMTTDQPATLIPTIRVTSPSPVLAPIETIITAPAQTELLSPVHAYEIASLSMGRIDSVPANQADSVSTYRIETIFPVVEIPWHQLIILPFGPTSIPAPVELAGEHIANHETTEVVPESTTPAPITVSRPHLASTHSSTNSIESLGPVTPRHDSTLALEPIHQPTIYYPSNSFPTIAETSSVSQAGLEGSDAMDVDVEYEFIPKTFEDQLDFDSLMMEIDSDLDYSTDSSGDIEMDDSSDFFPLQEEPGFPTGVSAPFSYGLPYRRPTTFEPSQGQQDVRMVSDPRSVDEDIRGTAEYECALDQSQDPIWSSIDWPPTPPLVPSEPLNQPAAEYLVPSMDQPVPQEYPIPPMDQPFLQEYPIPSMEQPITQYPINMMTEPMIEDFPMAQPQVVQEPMMPYQPTIPYESTTQPPASFHSAALLPYIPTIPFDVAPGPISEFEMRLAEEIPFASRINTATPPPAYTPKPTPVPGSRSTAAGLTTPRARDQAPAQRSQFSVTNADCNSIPAPGSVRRPPVERCQASRPRSNAVSAPLPTTQPAAVPASLHNTIPTGANRVPVAGPPAKPKETPTHTAPAGLELTPLGGKRFNPTTDTATFVPGKGKKQCTSTNLEEAVMNGSVTVPTKRLSAAAMAQFEQRKKERQAKVGEKAQREADAKYASMFHNTNSSYYNKTR